MITEIAFVAIPVTDIARSRRFYEDTLGLRPGYTGKDGNWAEYDIGSGTIGIGSYPGWEPSPQGTNVAFEVDDLDAEIGRLKARGVKVHLEITDTPVCRFAIICDPDGNKILIHKRKHKA